MTKQQATPFLSAAHSHAYALYQSGDLAAANAAYAALLQQNKGDADAWCGLGIIQTRLNNTANAEKFFRTALAANPDHVAALQQLAAIALAAKDPIQATSMLQRALKAAPDDVVNHQLLGAALIGQGKLGEALRVLADGYAIAPQNPDLVANYIIALRKAGQAAKALDVFAALPEVARNAPENILLHAHILGDIPDYPALGRLCDAVLQATPDAVDFIIMKAQSLKHAGAFEQAAAMLRAHVENAENNKQSPLYARLPMLYNALGMMEYSAGRLDRALECYDRSLYDAPAAHATHHNKGICLLAAGRYGEAWPHFEWRNHKDSLKPLIPARKPQWDGAALGERALLVYADYGIGDTVCMARYLPLIRAAHPDAAIIVEAPAKLLPLLRASVEGIQHFMETSDIPHAKAPKFDTYISFMSLPAVFNTTKASIPSADAPYLNAPKGGTAIPPASGDTLTIGLSWYSSNPENGALRSLTPADFAFIKHATDRPVRIVNLQYNPSAEDVASLQGLGFDVVDLAGLNVFDDLAGMAALITSCDLILSIDNTTVHMAGALGVPCMVFLHDLPDWRWGRSGSYAPWYGSIRLYRQDATANKWQSALQAAQEDLSHFIKAGNRFADTPPAPLPEPAPQSTKPSAVLLNDTGNWYHWGCYGTSMALRHYIGQSADLTPILHQDIAATTAPPPENTDAFDSPLLRAQWRAQNPTLYRHLETADIVYINGEGTIHGTSPMCLKLLYLAYLAGHHMGKPVHIINHSCFPQGGAALDNPVIRTLYKKVYDTAARIVVRDPLSQELLKQIGIQADLGFDCLPLYIGHHYADRLADLKATPDNTVMIAGSSAFSAQDGAITRVLFDTCAEAGLRPVVLLGAPRDAALDDAAFLHHLTTQIGAHGAQGQNTGLWDLVEAQSFDEWITHLARARLLVSGRFHYSIAAYCTATPLIAFEGNTPKMGALTAGFGLLHPLSYTAPDAAAQLRRRMDEILTAEATPPLSESNAALLAALLHERLAISTAMARVNFTQ